MLKINRDREIHDHCQQLKDAKIMMVDDESINMEVIQIYLEEEGYNNFILTDQSTQALEILDRERPDILLLDLMMPEVTGFDILAAMMENNALKHIPVVVLTSSNDAETKLRALGMGATDFLAKPVDSSELILRLKNTLTVKAYHDQLAYFDTVTGLPNRRLFLDRLDWTMQNARREEKAAAVLHVGFDRIHQIYDSFGAKVGDQLIVEVAQRLKVCLRGNDVITRHDEEKQADVPARIGGEEFSIILSTIQKIENAALVAQRIIEAIAEPFFVDGNKLFIKTSIGIASFPADAKEANQLLTRAASATNHALSIGSNNYSFYSKEINQKSAKRLKLEGELRQAIENGELLLQYQPKVDVKSQQVIGSEALIRWNHPKHGMVSPIEFIPLAEETELIVPIGEWVLHEACRQNRSWHLAGFDELTISVNVSSKQFGQPGLMPTVKQALEASGLAPQYLTLELTESVVMENAEKNIATLQHLKELGISISIDDFGTGYSSLSYLKKFPLDELKIDRSFIMDSHKNSDDAAIVSAIISLAHDMDLKVVAEGIEEEEQLLFLKQRYCDQIQGFFFSKPLPQDEFLKYVEQMDK